MLALELILVPAICNFSCFKDPLLKHLFANAAIEIKRNLRNCHILFSSFSHQPTKTSSALGCSASMLFQGRCRLLESGTRLKRTQATRETLVRNCLWSLESLSCSPFFLPAPVSLGVLKEGQLNDRVLFPIIADSVLGWGLWLDSFLFYYEVLLQIGSYLREL